MRNFFNQKVWRALMPLAITLAVLGQSPAQASEPCTYALSPIERTHGYGATTDRVSVVTTSGCAWTVVNTNTWIDILSSASGAGTSDILYSVDANPSSAERTGVLVIADQPFNVTQRGRPCTYKLSPTGRTHGYGATGGAVSLTSVIGCPWTVENTNAWITITTSLEGTGSTEVNYTVAANPGPNDRSGTVVIGGETFVLIQTGAPCTYTLTPTSRNHGYGASAGTIGLNTLSGCSWTIVNTNSWISITTSPNGQGSTTVNYTVVANPGLNDRIGVVTIGGAPFTLTQAGVPCTYALTPTTRTHGYGAAVDSVSLATLDGCAWSVVNTNTWITITSNPEGSGSAIINYTVAANEGPDARTGTLVIGGETLVLTQTGALCEYALSPTSRNHGYGASAGMIGLTTLSGCTWTIVNTNSWISITTSPNGQGSTTVNYTVVANPGLNDRTGVVTIGGTPFTLIQAGVPCTYALTPTTRTHGYGAAADSVNLVALDGCVWSVVNTNTWITIASNPEGSGSATINYTVAANEGPNARTGTLVIGGETVVLTQTGAPCEYALSPTSRNHGYGASAGTIGLTTLSGCSWTIVNTNSWITITTSSNGQGSTTVNYNVADNSGLNDRTGVVTVGGTPFTLIQAGVPCTYALTPINRTHGYGAATDQVSVVTLDGCTWDVVNTNTWITINSAPSMTGSGDVEYAVQDNPGIEGRAGVIVIANQVFSVSQVGRPCTYKLSPIDRTHGYGAAADTVDLTTLDGCTWTVVNTNDWITISSSPTGTGSTQVQYSVDANAGLSNRTGVVTIGSEAFRVTQIGSPCTYSITPGSRTHGYGAAAGTVSVTTLNGCEWLVENTNSWITITSGLTGTGPGEVSYSVAANDTFNDRSGVVVIGGQPFNLGQQGQTCSYKLSPEDRLHGSGASSGTVSVTANDGCNWTVSNTNAWITISSSTTGSGNGEFSYTIPPNISALERTGLVFVADQVFTLNQRGAFCLFEFSPTNRIHGPAQETAQVAISSLTSCSWTVVSTNSWITLTSSPDGTNFGTVTYTVAPNPTRNERTGMLTIPGDPFALFTVTQSGSDCTWVIAPTEATHGPGSESGLITVTAGDGCNWTVENPNDWITISAGESGSGDGSVSYEVSANTGLEERTGQLVVANQLFTVTQQFSTVGVTLGPITMPAATGQMKLTLSGVPGEIWEVQGSTNLVHWDTLSRLTNTLGTIDFIDLGTTNFAQRFYRAVKQQ